MSKPCPSCGAPIDATAKNCPYCGTIIPQEKKEAAEPATHETPVIIQQVAPPRQKKYNRDKTTAALLAFFLGGLGIDQFYVGNNGWGLVLLLITLCSLGWGLIFTGFVALIHFIQFLIMSQEDFDNKYNY